MLRFIETSVFGGTHDLCLKSAIRGGQRPPVGSMQTPSVKVWWADEIMDLRNAEEFKVLATNNAHAAALADEASGATTITVGNAPTMA